MKSGNKHQLELVGFDISGVQFPKTNLWGLQFVISDIHKGFPEEYNGTFDVVHLRLLVLVITVEQMPNATANFVKLLSKSFPALGDFPTGQEV